MTASFRSGAVLDRLQVDTPTADEVYMVYMRRVRALVRGLVRDSGGQDLIEYALLAAIIALGVTAAMGSVRAALNGQFSAVSGRLGTPGSQTSGS